MQRRDDPEPRDARSRPTVHWALVVVLLVVTFGAMLGSIYRVVKSAQP